MAVLDKKTYRHIEGRLFHYFDLRRQVAEYDARRQAITDSSRNQFTGGRHGVSYRSDPTATKAIDLVGLTNEQADAAAWVEVIEHVICKYERSEKGKLLQLKYFDEMSDGYIQEKLAIERATYFRWRNELVLYTALVAASKGLIKV